MDSVPANSTAPARRFLDSRWLAWAVVLSIALLLALYYVPVLFWLGQLTARVSQIYTGGVLVIIAMGICLRDTVTKLRLEPNVNEQGLGLIVLALACLWLVGYINVWAVPMVLLSLCLAFAGVVTFFFGNVGARTFLPALAGFLVFGLMLGMFPQLDWPLRKIAAKYAGRILAMLGAPFRLGVVAGGPPELVLVTQGHFFWVATECNGFGVLVSGLLLATILAIHRGLPFLDKVSLIGLALPVALVANFLRIVSICLLAPRWKMIHYHTLHEIVGAFFYYLALGVIWWVASRFARQHAEMKESSRGRDASS